MRKKVYAILLSLFLLMATCSTVMAANQLYIFHIGNTTTQYTSAPAYKNGGTIRGFAKLTSSTADGNSMTKMKIVDGAGTKLSSEGVFQLYTWPSHYLWYYDTGFTGNVYLRATAGNTITDYFIQGYWKPNES